MEKGRKRLAKRHKNKFEVRIRHNQVFSLTLLLFMWRLLFLRPSIDVNYNLNYSSLLLSSLIPHFLVYSTTHTWRNSRISIIHAEKVHSGTYSCSADNTTSSTVNIQILMGKWKFRKLKRKALLLFIPRTLKHNGAEWLTRKLKSWCSRAFPFNTPMV